jgi:predicted GNAT family N-acyltransferase
MEVKASVRNIDIFKPIDFTITLETQEEVEAMYALFNYAPNTCIIEKYGINHTKIREKLHSVCSYLNYNRIHSELCKSK